MKLFRKSGSGGLPSGKVMAKNPRAPSTLETWALKPPGRAQTDRITSSADPNHGTDPLRTAGTGISPTARISRRTVAAALGCGGDDAARQRRCAGRAIGGARDRTPRTAHDPEGGAAAGAGRGRRLAARGLAACEFARDAKAARSCHRNAAVA